MSKEIVELVVVFGTFYVAVMTVMVPMLRANRKETRQLHTELKADIGRVEAKIDKEIGSVRSEIGGLRTELQALSNRIDGTNLRIDRLGDRLAMGAEKVS